MTVFNEYLRANMFMYCIYVKVLLVVKKKIDRNEICPREEYVQDESQLQRFHGLEPPPIKRKIALL
jgi:hypothetical protein